MKNTISLPVQTPAVAAGQKAGAAGAENKGAPEGNAEPVKAMKRDPLMEAMPPQVRKVLEAKQTAKNADRERTSPAVTELPEKAAPMAAARPEGKPEEELKSSDEVKGGEVPDAGIIDFMELETEALPGEEEGLKPLTEAELADLNIVKTKLTDAHKDNAHLRKQRREATEAKEQLLKDNAELKKQLEEVQAARQVPQTGNYLDRYQSVEEVHAAKADAMEVLRQLQEEPERAVITLPGNRQWKMLGAEGEALHGVVAQTALEILDGYDARVKQLGGRGESEKLVKEKLPAISKAIPDFEKRYQANLEADWHAEAPKLSLHAAIGELVTSGQYVLRVRQAPAAVKVKTVKPAAGDEELPSTTPPMRQVNGGEAEVAALRAKYLKTRSPKDLSAWIQAGGKKHQAA